VFPLIGIAAVAPPRLAIRPGTKFGAALDLLADCVRREVIRTTAESRGDYRPLVFIMTDGQPTDSWRQAAERLREVRPGIANIYAIGCGDEADFSCLKNVADACIRMQDLSSGNISKFFVWMSASIQSMSIGTEGKLGLDKLPLGDGFELVEPGSDPSPGIGRRRLFFHVLCQKKRGSYLLRYMQASDPGTYGVQGAFPLPEDFFSEGEMESPAVSSDMLHGAAACPYCGNGAWAQCGCCKRLFCNAIDSPDSIECPHCGKKLVKSRSGGSFGVQGSPG
ncbi:MAG: hypothetical protein LBE84_08500, partial [Planctomycetota bacterium]|jgi:uncharacterized protein YegL/DNA-directed RNA polymerase subunit RPC12/RpoP|nr:hypothetical protein [Planctomycetota bacterium]